MRLSWIVLVGLLLAACTGGGAAGAPTASAPADPSAAPTAESHAVHGTLTLADREAFLRFDENGELDDEKGDFCVAQTTSGYSDIQSGVQVVVRDESGTVLGTARTVGGAVGGTYDRKEKTCVWTFVVEDVPTADFYTIELGRRSGPTYSIDEMVASGWTVDLVIGN